MKKLTELFRDSAQEFRQVRTVTACAMLGAVALVLSSMSVTVIPSVRIGFSGIPNLVVAWLFGPVVGTAFNGTMDILKYLMKPQGAYFLPLTLVTCVSGCLYGCFFYRRPMRLWRVFAAKFVVAVICNVGLNTWCLSMLYGKGFFALLAPRILNNLVLWPLDSLIFFYLAKMLETSGVFRPFGIARVVKNTTKNRENC